MGRIAVFTDDPGWHGKALRLAFAARGYSADYVSLTECRLNLVSEGLPVSIPGFEHALPDAVFVRGVPGGSLEEVVFYLDILHALKIIGVPVYNDAGAIERSVDKAMTSFLLRQNDLPTPPTWVLRDRKEALTIAECELAQGRMIISKPLFGSQGEGVRRIEKMLDLFWLTGSRGIYYLQRFVDCYGEGYSDTRVFVINGRAVAAMRRKGTFWLNNVAKGASCERVQLESELSKLAIKTAEVVKMDYAGVDIIREKNGDYTVIEVNSIPAWKGLQSVCDINIAELLVADLLDRLVGDHRPELQTVAS
ncbi:ATP-grasp domain-containing protein [Methylotuvimicrobium buryatense]|uniref:RimK family alpha-L-glutamate ligase n=1 Tax=Methylotuvimicrobium buryatense TaxID=95641 RepID=A0A4P9UMJ0_METBY|nr:RimK family alpha-L-glutamate ligase [Methylotuvimicrobium buryatense]QCW82387.1 RimK family alpha-L-glutamate ligase [Methylotuvimicrobium buryatense]